MLIHAKRYTSQGLLLLFVFSVVFTLNSCTQQTPSSFEPAKTQSTYLSKRASVTKEEAAKDIRLIAEGIAFVLRDELNRRILETEMKLANTVEDKIDVVKFIRATRTISARGQTSSTSFEAMFASVLNEQERIDLHESLKGLPPGTFDAYFPVRDHREHWKSSSSLLVVAVDPNLKNILEEEISAFSLDGNTVMLDRKAPPQIPVLAVTMNETRGTYSKKRNNSEEPESFYEKIKGGGGDITDCPECPPPPLYCFRLDQFLIGRDYEGWLDGDMEIFFKINNGAGWYNTWERDGVEPQRWYNYGTNVACFNSPGSILVEIWECDWSTNDFVADQWYNQGYPSYGPVYWRVNANWIGWENFYGSVRLDDIAGGSDIDQVTMSFVNN